MKTLQRFIKIIDLLKENNNLRLKDISNMLNIDKSTVYRYLKTLQKGNLVNRDDVTRRYSLGLGFLNIATKIIDSMDIRDIAHQHLAELGELTEETVHLTTFDGKWVVYIDKIESKKPVRMYSRIGNVAPIFCTAVGKATLAFQSKKKIEEIINETEFIPYTKNTITDKRKFKECLKEVKERGFALDNSEYEEAIFCIAAPIWNYDRVVKNAVSITAVKSRMSLSELITFKDVLLEKCNIISKNLGFLKK